MIGLVMCGGKGTRMAGEGEKLLLRYRKPLVQHVVSALEESSCFSRVVCATSKNAPRTAEFVGGLGVEVVETAGGGYVRDLSEALKGLAEEVFVVSGDLALLDADIVKTIVGMHDASHAWTSVLVSKGFLDSLGLRAEFLVRHGETQCAYTGISIVDPKRVGGNGHVEEDYILIDDKRVAFNLNTKEDYDLLGAA